MSQYPPMFYGTCLSRIVHFIVHLRRKYPNRRILLSKLDYSDAYRRMSHHWSATAQTILVVNDIAYIMLRLAFGGSPNPPCWCAFSETMTDVANDLMASPLFREKKPKSILIEPRHTRVVEYPKLEAPFAEGLESCYLETNPATSLKEIYIDDGVNVALDKPEDHEVEFQALPIAAQAFSRPHAGEDQEPIPRKAIFAGPKVDAEGLPREILQILGWGLDTRRMVMFLPEEKFAVWLNDIKELCQPDRMVSLKELESTIGRLNHSTRVIPLSRHFLKELRARVYRTRNKTWNPKFRLSREERADLKVWEHFLNVGRKGISLNLMIDRMPTHLAWSDSCPVGLGGYTLSGRAWRVLIPKEFPFWGDSAANNFLEFLGMYVSTELLILETKPGEYPCFLAIGDNTSAIAWIHRLNLEKDSHYYEVGKSLARRMARKIIGHGAKLDSQHLKGKKNVVSDLLSFHADWRTGETHPFTIDDPDNETLTERFHSHMPHLIPQTFRISQLPEDVESFVFATLQTYAVSYTRSKKLDTGTESEPGGGGKTTSTGLESLTPSSLRYRDKPHPGSPRDSSLSSDLPSSISRDEFMASVRNPWWLKASQQPLASWHRRCGITTGRVLSTSRREPTVRLKERDGAETSSKVSEN